jgi:hypothetical protein
VNAHQNLIAWKQAVVQNLASVDADMANFIRDRRVSIGFWKCGAHVGAFWLPGNRIFLNLRHFSLQTDPKAARIQSILVHEIRHLQQGFFTALSVYGELEAWQLGFRVYHELTGEPYHPNLVELMSLPLGWDRVVLRRAQALMQVYASKAYRSDLLPLYPWGREIKYRLGFRS